MTVSQKAFTLLELVIVMGITTLVGVLLVGILIQNNGLFYTQSSRVTQGLGANDALGNIKGFIKQAKGVVVGYPETGSPNYISSDNELILKISSVDSLGNLLPTFDYVIYLKSQDKLNLLLFPDDSSARKTVDQFLTSNVDFLSFEYFDSAGGVVGPSSAKKVRVTISSKQKSGLKDITNIATSEAYLRND